MTNETTSIPLNKLVVWDGNVRKTGVSDGIDELAASIAARGLLQSLVVRKAKRGKYAVIAGQRRLLALQKLAADKIIAKDADIPCAIASDDADPSELSLAENVVRMPMHPADQFEAFRDLIDSGASIADVAARFGVSENLVAKRLKLGRVSPVILDAYRRNELSLELVQAFAISDDREAQERVWNDTPPWNLHPRIVKRALTEDEVPVSDKRMKLIGLDAYEAAGGIVRRDLFDPENGGTVLDAALLDALVAKALEEAADSARGEGWKWIEITPELTYEHLSGFKRRYAEDVPLSDDEQVEVERLTAEYDDLCDTDDPADHDRCHEIDARLDELAARAEFWPPETLAIAGAIVSLGAGGAIRIERGLVRDEDRPAKPREKPNADKPVDGKPALTLSATLIEDLTAQKSAAISAELLNRPDIALAAVVHVLALYSLYSYERDSSCLKIAAATRFLRGSLYAPEDCGSFVAVEAERERWGDHLPGDPADLWHWCLEQPQEVLLDLLAIIAARSVDAVVPKNRGPHPHGDLIARAVSLDMANHFTPTAANFFGRISSAGIIAAICEAKGVAPAPAWAKMKKAELALLAERQIAGTHWLPEPLRIVQEADATAEDSESEDAAAEAEGAEYCETAEAAE